MQNEEAKAAKQRIAACFLQAVRVEEGVIQHSLARLPAEAPGGLGGFATSGCLEPNLPQLLSPGDSLVLRSSVSRKADAKKIRKGDKDPNRKFCVGCESLRGQDLAQALCDFTRVASQPFVSCKAPLALFPNPKFAEKPKTTFVWVRRPT